jgi:VCBS repeat protein/FG-GAP repeat protein
VKVFSGADNSLLANLRTFNALYTGGVRVAAGDVNGDGRADIIAGRGSGPAVVKVFDGRTRQLLPGPLSRLLVAQDPGRGGVFVAAGDVNGDGRADIITAAGPVGAQMVRTYDGATGAKLAEFQPYEPTLKGDVRVGLADVDGDGRLDIITGAGSATNALFGQSEVRYFDALSLEELDSFFFADPKSKVGVFVAGSQ